MASYSATFDIAQSLPLAFDVAFGLMRGSSFGPANNRGIGMPIGSVELPRQYAHSFRLELQTALIEPIRFRGVDKNNADPAMLTLHLPSVAAAGLDDEHPDLLRFLEDHQGVYHAGVRRRCPTLDLAQPAMHPAREEAVKDDEGTFRFVELFAGIGGFRLGLENPEVGGQCVLSNELNPRAAAIYRANFADSPSCLAEGDILDIASENILDFDCLVGGFPCQPFTNRGDQKGLDDDRGQLYRELGRILQDKQPKCFIFENVTGLVTLDGGWRTGRVRGERPTFATGAVFERILDTFRSCGYKVDWNVLNSRKWLPQMRERVYIIGTRNDLGPGCDLFDWDSLVLKGLTGESASTVRDIMEAKNSPSVIAQELTASQFAKAQSIHSGRGTLLLEDGRIDPDRKSSTIISRYHDVSSITTKFLFEEADGTPRRRPRFLTPRECARLMGFREDFAVPAHDDNVAVSHFYKAIGNAVCPPVVADIGKELKRCIGEESTGTKAS